MQLIDDHAAKARRIPETGSPVQFDPKGFGAGTSMSAHGFIRSIVVSYQIRLRFVRERVQAIAGVGIIGFPLFYLIWKYVIPQPYENLALRLLGSALCAGMLVIDRLPPRYERVFNAYCYLTILYCLPFFFTFMLLYNDVNSIWLGSTVCAIAYLILLLDALNLILVFAVGSALAVGAVLFSRGPGFWLAGYLDTLPILGFGLLGAFVFDHHQQAMNGRHQARVRAALAVGSTVAHEMRTPLLAIRFDATGIAERLQLSQPDSNLEHLPKERLFALSDEDILDIEKALERIRQQTHCANTMIEMLLVNARTDAIARTDFAKHSMTAIVSQAIGLYPFKDGERTKIQCHFGADFIFFGSDVLMRHVLFNLMKNALRAIAEVGKGGIEIRLEPGLEVSRLMFRDTGSGISEADLRHLFTPFWSGRLDDCRVGIGLTFVRRVVISHGGTIECRSSLGEFTEFAIFLPLPE